MRTTAESNFTVRSYVIGFILCVVLTLTAFTVVSRGLLEGWLLLFAIIELGMVQLLVQLLLFLHLGQESKPRWKLWAFMFMMLVVGIVVAGSLWIMSNLSYNMSHNEHTDSQIIEDEGITPSRYR